MRNGKMVLAEVGVGPPSMSYGLLVAQNPNVHVLLFEPRPDYFAALKEAAAGRDNIELFNVAIGDENGRVWLSDEGTSSALQGVASPSTQHKGAAPTSGFEVDVRRISEFDKGDIDILRVDTEGHEWACLRHLVSCPREIVVEIYNDLATYINPHLYEIGLWAETNGYQRAAVHDSDFIYRK